jgi:uncharacterized membrane protein
MHRLSSSESASAAINIRCSMIAAPAGVSRSEGCNAHAMCLGLTGAALGALARLDGGGTKLLLTVNSTKAASVTRELTLSTGGAFCSSLALFFSLTAEPGTPRMHRQPSHSMADVVDRNIQALLERQRAAQIEGGAQERIASAITRFMSSLLFIYIHVVIVGGWVLINVGWTPLPRFDPTFVLLATIASVEAIFLTSFVLMTQQRMQEDVDRRADLDLQISLLTEHEITQLAKVVNGLAARLGAPQADTPEVAEIQHDVQPEAVLDALEKKKREFRAS